METTFDCNLGKDKKQKIGALLSQGIEKPANPFNGVRDRIFCGV